MAPAIDTELAQKTESLKKKSPVGVVGTGLVGAGWAIVFARGGHPVRLFDSVPGAAERAIEVINDRVVGLAEHKLIDSPESILENLSVAHSLESAIEGVAYVQESVFEQVEPKTKVLEALAGCLPPNAVVGSSSSGIPASKFTEHLSIRSRVLIVHPVNPPYLIPLVELVPTPWTVTSAVDFAEALMKSVGQSPIRLLKEVEGFVLNRLQGALLREA
jgi:L-gulonate 3-dehydrogenase